jgi:hypothetical protein
MTTTQDQTPSQTTCEQNIPKTLPSEKHTASESSAISDKKIYPRNKNKNEIDEENSLGTIESDADADDEKDERTKPLKNVDFHHYTKFDKRIEIPLKEGTTFINFVALQNDTQQVLKSSHSVNNRNS